MNPVSLIARKRDGHTLSFDEIAWFMDGFVRGEVADYQMSAMAMAIYCRGMSTEETASLTECMLRSGEALDWPDSTTPKVDKHSTGGIGDKVSLVLAPMLACCGLAVPMISGRGLGASGGTLDKLESIPGFRTNLSTDEIRRQVDKVGCVITGQTANLVPADKKLYALRDVTGTVPSIPLITASIMSKKLAEGLDALVLDVKHGTGAFMKSPADARALAASLVGVGKSMGLATTALLTDMNQPLGRMAGNTVEVDESILALEGDGPADLMEVTLALGAELLVSTKKAKTVDKATKLLQAELDSGRALEKFYEMVRAQGGDPDAPRPVAAAYEVAATKAGYVAKIDTEQLGWAIITLGGGRMKLTDAIDHSVGLEMQVRLGDEVHAGDTIARVFAHRHHVETARQRIAEAVVIVDEAPPLWPLVKKLKI